jgi:hypothetical protein
MQARLRRLNGSEELAKCRHQLVWDTYDGVLLCRAILFL